MGLNIYIFDSECNEKCIIGFTMKYVLFLFFVSVNTISTKRIAPIYVNINNFSDRKFRLVYALRR